MNKKKLWAIIGGIVIIVAITIPCVYLFSMDSEEETRAFKVETPFIDLEYPSKWQENLNIEWLGTNHTGCVLFYAKNEEGDEKEIFKVHFNEDAQIPIGVLQSETGSNINVGYSLTDPQFDENWSSSEKNTFYSMQNDVNFIIQQISKDKRFTK